MGINSKNTTHKILNGQHINQVLSTLSYSVLVIGRLLLASKGYKGDFSKIVAMLFMIKNFKIKIKCMQVKEV